jgi:hypothetical protein
MINDRSADGEPDAIVHVGLSARPERRHADRIRASSQLIEQGGLDVCDGTARVRVNLGEFAKPQRLPLAKNVDTIAVEKEGVVVCRHIEGNTLWLALCG